MGGSGSTHRPVSEARLLGPANVGEYADSFAKRFVPRYDTCGVDRYIYIYVITVRNISQRLKARSISNL